MIESDSDREMRRVPEDKGEDLEKMGGEWRVCVEGRADTGGQSDEQVMLEQGLCSRDDPK